MSYRRLIAQALWRLIGPIVLTILVGHPAFGAAGSVPRLGFAEPGTQTVFERAVQLHVVSTGPFRVEVVPPRHFTDQGASDRTIPASLLEWRLAGSGMGWNRLVPGEPTTVWVHGEKGGSEHLLEIDYRLTVPWDAPASVGGYVLDVPYAVVGEAVLHAGTVWPGRVPVGETVTFACVRERAVGEEMYLQLYDAQGQVVERTEFTAGDRPHVAFQWTASLAPGEYPFRLVGSETGLCAAGRIEVTGRAIPAGWESFAQMTASTHRVDITLTAAFDSPVGIGQWARLTLRVANRGSLPAHALRVELTVPPGLFPLWPANDLKIGDLPAGAAWQGSFVFQVMPTAEPSVVEVRLLGQGEGFDGELLAKERVAFAPEADVWLQARARMFGTDQRIELDQGWHVLWPGESSGHSAVPHLYDVRGAAPLRHPEGFNEGSIPSASGLRGAVGVVGDREGVRPYAEGSVSFSLEGIALAVSRRDAHDRRSSGWWQLAAPADSRWQENSGWMGRVIGERGRLSGLQIGWHSMDVDTVDRVQLVLMRSTDGAPRAEVRFETEDTEGGFEVRRSIRSDSGLRIGLWRPAPLGRVDLHAELDSPGGGDVRIGIGYEGAVTGGRVGARMNWRPTPPTGMPSSAFSLRWTGERHEGTSPFIGLARVSDGFRAYVGFDSRHLDGEDVVRVGLAPGRGKPEIAWQSRWEQSGGSGYVALKMQPESTRGEVFATLAPSGRWELAAEATVQAGNAGQRVEAVVALSGERVGVRWGSGLEATDRTIQSDHRIDVRSEFLPGERLGTIGMLAGARTVQGRPDGEEIQSTRAAFVGAWIEVEAIPRTWAGVALAKWNRENWTEYDVYLRHEVMPTLWLQVGVHQSPGHLTLFPDHGRGTYARLLWAVHVES